jgi:hypothetical protein
MRLVAAYLKVCRYYFYTYGQCYHHTECEISLYGKCSYFVTKQSDPSVYFTALMSDGEVSSKMSVHFYQITRCHGPGGSKMHCIILKGQHHEAQSLIS